MSTLDPHESRFVRRCEAYLGQLKAALPPAIAESLHGLRMKPNDTYWWFSIPGTNGRACKHPKFWDATVSTYFMAQERSNQRWMVGQHFCTGHKQKCSSHLYSPTMRRILQCRDGQEGFIYRVKTNRRGSDNLRIATFPSDAEADSVLVPRLGWLIATTWPEIAAMLKQRGS